MIQRTLSVLLLLAGSLAALEPELEFKDPSGQTIAKYVVEAPANPAPQLGLIFCSQEHDTPTGNDIFPVRQSLLRLGLANQFVLLSIAPQSRKFGPADHQPIEKLIAWAMKTYPTINPRRVYMFGKGEGSKISMEFTMTHPQLSTAAIGYSWGAWLMPSEVDKPIDFVNQAPELYLTLGRRDLDNHLTCVRDAYPRLKAKGYHLIHREFDELADRSYHPVSNDDALSWATRLRNKTLPLSAEETRLLRAFSAKPPAPVNGYYPTLALVGGAPAGAVLQKLFLSPDPAVRLAAAQTAQHGIYGPATTTALAKLTADASRPVSQAAIRALALLASWRYPEAQSALIQLAIDQTADHTSRLSAADGLAHAARLQVKGIRQDPALFAALAALAAEKDEPLRATASLALAPAYEPPPPGAPRRRSPEGGWQKWVESLYAAENVETKNYDICASTGREQALDTFCRGGEALRARDLAKGFALTLQAAEAGYVPAQAAVAMLYANGQGTQQNYAEAGQWWLKAGAAGDLVAARHAWNLYSNGEGVERNPTLANQMAPLIGEPIRQPRTPKKKA
jgi:TPR repeat protein